MRSALALGIRTLLREWRSGDLAVLFLALFVAVAALTGVGFLADRIQQAMRMQANEVLAADLRLQSLEPLSESYVQEARGRGVRTANSTSTMSVVLRGDHAQLSNVHAVSAGYPLRGVVKAASVPFGEARDVAGTPAMGEVWPDSRLLAALDASVGDAITVGAKSLRVTRVLVSRPDQGTGFADLAPSLLMNEADLPATQLIQPGSRATYAALFAGTPAQLQEFLGWARKHVKAAEWWSDIGSASPQVGRASERATRFLSLASLAGVLLCAVAIAMTARRYVKRHLDLAALLKTLGAAQSTVLMVSLVQLSSIALLATAAGAAAGFVAQQGLLAILRDLIATELPAPGWQPLFMGLAAAVLLLVGFALPPMLQLSRVPAIRVLRRDIGPPPLGVMLAYGPAALAVALLIVWVTGDWRLALAFIAALAAAILVLAVVGWLLIRVVGRLRSGAGVSWRYGVANLARRGAESVVQVVALGLGLSILLLLTIIRGDLIDDWRAQLPDTVPNYFFVNIPAGEREAFTKALGGEGGSISRILPMLRGRLVAINSKGIGTLKFANGRASGFVWRDQNITWTDSIGPDNVITAGKWFSAEDHGKPLISVATELQESMGLKLGDRLMFDVAGERVTVTISSFRKVQWDSLQPNFFLIFAPGLLDGAAGTYMASAQFKPAEAASVARLVREFPSISIFDTGDLLAQVRSIIDKAVLAVQSVFLFTLLAGVVVLLAAVNATRDERRYESAMLRALGASRATVRTGVLVEFGLIGTMAGLVAVAVASSGAGLLARQLLEIPFHSSPVLWFASAAAGAALVCAAGYAATRSALSQSPMTVLRHV